MIGRGGGRVTEESMGEPGLTPPGPAPAPPAPPQPPTCVASAMTTGRAPTEPAPRAGPPKAGGHGPVLSGMDGWLATTRLALRQSRNVRSSVRGWSHPRPGSAEPKSISIHM